MKRILCKFYVLVLITLCGIQFGHAQPKIPKERIPSNIPATIKQEIERLYSSDPAERGKSAFVLKRMGKKAKPAIPFLVDILSDESPLIVTSIPPSRLNTSPGQEAAKALARIGRAGQNALITALKDDNPDVRGNVVRGLAMVEGMRALSLLRTTLGDKNAKVRIQVIEALAETEKPQAVEHMISALKDENPDVRKCAASELGPLKDTQAVIPLIATLKDEDPHVRANATRALGIIKDHRAVDPLMSALNDTYSGVRLGAVRALHEMKLNDPRLVELFITALKDESFPVRIQAAIALGKTKNPRAVQPLTTALEDKFVKAKAAEALKDITGKIFGEDPLKWQNFTRRLDAQETYYDPVKSCIKEYQDASWLYRITGRLDNTYYVELIKFRDKLINVLAKDYYDHEMLVDVVKEFENKMVKPHFKEKGHKFYMQRTFRDYINEADKELKRSRRIKWAVYIGITLIFLVLIFGRKQLKHIANELKDGFRSLKS